MFECDKCLQIIPIGERNSHSKNCTEGKSSDKNQFGKRRPQSRDRKSKTRKLPQVDDVSEKLFKCSECDKEYQSSHSLDKHKDQVHRQHKYVCDWQDCQYSTSLRFRMLTHQKRHLKLKTFHCDWPGCDSSFVAKLDLFLHRSRHSDCKFKCSHCNREFKCKPNLKHHIMVAHTITQTNDRLFECVRCHKKYPTKISLNTHTRKIHSGIQFKCDKCDYKSNTREGVSMHNRRIHLLEKTYRCDVKGCEGKAFFRKSGLKCHQMSAHSDERRFVCDWPECGAKFKLKQNVAIHVKHRHTGQNKSHKKKEKIVK